jgi:hypothetical protein
VTGAVAEAIRIPVTVSEGTAESNHLCGHLELGMVTEELGYFPFRLNDNMGRRQTAAAQTERFLLIPKRSNRR